jgi:sarcosine oxidase delta subunit
VNHPTRSNLRCITYKDDTGETHDFKLIEKVSDKWLKAGMLLRLSKSTLDKYSDKAEKDNIKICEYVFSKWVKRGGHEDYPLTWQGLYTLLIDMGRRTVADKLYKVLKTRETKEDKYVDTMYRVVC